MNYICIYDTNTSVEDNVKKKGQLSLYYIYVG